MAHPKAVRDAVRRDYIAQVIAPDILGANAWRQHGIGYPLAS